MLQAIPALEGVVLLNINSWSAGCSAWDDSTQGDGLGPSRIDDQLMEVVGLYSSLHVGKIQVSLDKPVRLGQASVVTVSIVLVVCGEVHLLLENVRVMKLSIVHHLKWLTLFTSN